MWSPGDVSVGGDAGQHFVNIAGVVLDDSGVYTIEVCSESGGGVPDVTLFNLICSGSVRCEIENIYSEIS